MKTFAELSLIAPVQKAVAAERYRTPTPIQAQTIPPALQGQDVLGCAQTGTGKTAAFALPILSLAGARPRKAMPHRPFVLVLAPTRELAIQIGERFTTYGKHLHLRQALVYGGVNQTSQVRALKRGAHIVVATPGRLLDLMNQRYIELDQLDVFVLDEADRMLDMGFLPDLQRIISKLPAERQSLFFSATLPPKIVELAQGLLRNPAKVNVTPETRSVDKIEQQVLFVEPREKQPLLQDILTRPGVDRVLVFTRTKRGANTVVERLLKQGLNATAIHGNKSQAARQKALDAFRRRRVKVLVATDVAARGIDIDGITHVINYDLPIEPEAYIHRIGRTGRAGASGIAISFCSRAERQQLRAIEAELGHRVATSESFADPSRTQFSPASPGPRKHRRKATAGRSNKPRHQPRKEVSGSGNSQRRRSTRRKRATPKPAIAS